MSGEIPKNKLNVHRQHEKCFSFGALSLFGCFFRNATLDSLSFIEKLQFYAKNLQCEQYIISYVYF